MAKVLKVTQSDLDKLPAEVRNDPDKMAIVRDLLHTLTTVATKLEALIGYDVVWVDDPQAPKAEVPVTATPATPIAPATEKPVALTGPLVDPPRRPDASEECRVERQVGVPARIKVWYPSVGKWWEPYNEVIAHVRPDDGRTVQVEDWVENGYSWHVLGGRGDEPPDNCEFPTMDIYGNRHLPRNVCIHVRKVE